MPTDPTPLERIVMDVPARFYASPRFPIVFGAIGGGFGLLSLAMVLFRGACEPVLSELLPLLPGLLFGGGHAGAYDPNTYFFWAAGFALLAIGCLATSIYALVLGPRQDRRVDAALRAELVETAHGAPLEPE
jgi:hypothetical protein